MPSSPFEGFTTNLSIITSLHDHHYLNFMSTGIEGTPEVIELFQKVLGPVDETWPPIEDNPSNEDMKYLRIAREVSKESPDPDVKVLTF